MSSQDRKILTYAVVFTVALWLGGVAGAAIERRRLGVQ